MHTKAAWNRVLCVVITVVAREIPQTKTINTNNNKK